MNMIPSAMRCFDVRWPAAAPGAAVWDILVDTARWREWGPSVREVDCSDRRIRAGSTGRVRTSLGFWVPFEVTDFDPLRRWGWKVGGLPATGHRVDKGPPGKSFVVFEVPLAAFPYGLVCLVAARRIARLAEEETARRQGGTSVSGNGHDSKVPVD
jgi:hypothetical protein